MSFVENWESLMAARDAAEKDHWSMPLYNEFYQAVLDDEEGSKNFNRLLERYMLASTEARAAMDDVLVAVCGWNMPSLAHKAYPQEAEKAH